MRYSALATDYDGTLARHGLVHPKTLNALRRFRQSGRRLILVTGRELPDMITVFPQYSVFDRIVAENGALLYDPGSRTETLLGEPPPEEFARALARKGVNPLAVGSVLIATREDQKQLVLDTIQEFGLESHIIFNKGALMILPSGVNKATGLQAALKDLGVCLKHTVGVGDAENDHAFLHACGCAVSVANALPTLKERSDLVTRASAGEGVIELIDRLMADELAGVIPKRDRGTLAPT